MQSTQDSSTSNGPQLGTDNQASSNDTETNTDATDHLPDLTYFQTSTVLMFKLYLNPTKSRKVGYRCYQPEAIGQVVGN